MKPFIYTITLLVFSTPLLQAQTRKFSYSEMKMGSAFNLIIVSTDSNKANHLAINSCLRPVCSIGGLSITTVEGTGAARKPDPKHLVQKSSSTRTVVTLDEDDSPVLEAAKKEADEKREQHLERQLQNQSEMIQVFTISTMGRSKKRTKDNDEEEDEELLKAC